MQKDERSCRKDGVHIRSDQKVILPGVNTFCKEKGGYFTRIEGPSGDPCHVREICIRSSSHPLMSSPCSEFEVLPKEWKKLASHSRARRYFERDKEADVIISVTKRLRGSLDAFSVSDRYLDPEYPCTQ